MAKKTAKPTRKSKRNATKQPAAITATKSQTTKPKIPKVEPTEKKSELQVRLLDMHTDELLKKRRVLVYVRKADAFVPMGHSVTDDKGQASINIDESHIKGKEEMEFKISVLDQRGKPMSLKKITVNLKDQKIQEFRLPASYIINHSINDVVNKLNLRLDDRTTAEFARRKISTLDDVRRLGGLETLGEAVPQAVAVDLQAMCDLSLVCDEIVDCVKLNQIGFSNPIRIANTPKTQFIRKIQGYFDQEKAGEIYQAAVVSTSYANTVLLGQLADAANNYEIFIPDIHQPGIPGGWLPTPPCQCKDCESAVSPLAYLTDLLRYALDHVALNGEKIEISDLMSLFHQPFDRLPASCESMEKKVRQARIAVEVLRQSIAEIPLTSGKQAELKAAEKAYCLEAYQDLLLRMGTSLAEIRLAHRADIETKQSIADKLALDDIARLDDLRIEPADLTEQKIQTIFGLANTKPSTQDPLAVLPMPEIEKWRLNFLRALWKKEDHPADELLDNQPIIDPDVIGPDDMRWPFENHPLEVSILGFNPNRIYMLWRKRRRWVDNRLRNFEQIPPTQVRNETVPDMQAMLESMLLPVAYDFNNETRTPWINPNTLDDLDLLHTKLSTGDADIVNDTLQHLREDLALEADAFCRLMELKRKHHFWSISNSDENLTNEEWYEFQSILVQIQKQRFFEVWRAEETSQNISLSPADFWISAQEPSTGSWPPVTLGQEPLIDPEKINRKHLPELKAGVRARDLWEQRKTEIKNITDALRNTLPDYAAALLLAVGNADPNNTSELILPHDLNELKAQLASPDNQVVKDTERIIEQDFHMLIEDFSRLLAILAKYEQTDPAKKPTETEQKDFIRILTSAQKQKKKYPRWLREEQSLTDPIPYWYARKAMLPPWRSGLEQRLRWQNTLRQKGLAPIIDPDLIDAGDIAHPVMMDAAYQIWKDRLEDIENKLSDIQTRRQSNGLDNVLTAIIQANSEEIKSLAQDELDGHKIDAYLAQLRLSRPAFAYLLTIVNLIEQGESVLDSEWEEVEAVLLQAWKEANYAKWRGEEQEKNLLLSPGSFIVNRMPERVLPKWRAKQDALRSWQDKLEARYDQQASIREGIQKAISDTAALVLPRLRDALIKVMTPGSTENMADLLSKRFFISMRESGCNITTRVSQAIVSIQGFLLALRMDQLQSIYPDLKLEAPTFDEDWKWMGSYATWRAVMFVFLYPENLLYPTLRRNPTTQMQAIVLQLNDSPMVSTEDLHAAAETYNDYLRKLPLLQPMAQCVAVVDRVYNKRRLFVFANEGYDIYWIAYDIDSNGNIITPALAYWEIASDCKGTILGVRPYYPPLYLDDSNNGYLYIFLRTPDNKIAFTRAAITPTLAVANSSPAAWSALKCYDNPNWPNSDRGILLEPSADNNFSFPNVPKLVVLLPLLLGSICTPENSNAVYEFALNAAGTEWGSIQEKGKLKKMPYTEKLIDINGSVKEEKNKQYEITAPFDGIIKFTIELPKYIAELEMGSRDYIGLYVKKEAGGATQDAPYSITLHPQNKQDSRSAELIVGVISGETISVGVYGIDKYHNVGDLPISFHLDAWATRTSIEFFYLEDIVWAWNPNPSLRIITKLQQLTSCEYRIWRRYDIEWEGADLFIANNFFISVRAICLQDNNIAVFWYENGVSHSMVINASLTQIIADGLSSVSGPVTMVRKINQDNIVVAKKLNAPANSALLGQTAYEWTLCTLGNIEGGWYRIEEHDLIIPAYIFPVAQPDNRDEVDFSISTVRQARQDYLADLCMRSSRWAAYATEAGYFLPVLFGLQLQQAGDYLEALDWFRCVYDYAAPNAQRKIYPGLVLEETVTSDFQRPEDWLEDPFNPHAIAAMRANAYTRYTLMIIAQCLIAYADSEFARNTVESLPMAQRLYEQAEELLNSPELVQGTSECDEIMGRLEIDLGVLNGSSRALYQRIRTRIANISDKQKRRALAKAITEIANSDQRLSEKISQVWKTLEDYPAQSVDTVAQTVRKKDETVEMLQKKIMASDTVYMQALSMNSLSLAGSGLQQYIPHFLTSSVFGFCIPKNPIADILRTKVRINLAKLRTCKNIAGVTRSVDPFAAATDTQTGMPYIAGGQIVLPGIAAVQPSQYRYKTLQAKADQLLAYAQQMENALLAAMEKEAQANYNILKARQELDMAKAGVKLQELRVTEAEEGVELTQMQRQSAQIRWDYYQELMETGLSEWEEVALAFEIAGVAHLHAAAAIKEAFTWGIGGIGDVGGALLATASLFKTQANYERRMQEWQFQSNLASNDITVGEKQIEIAEAHVDVVTEEKRIAELSVQNAEDTLEFLKNEFGTPELYRWMGNILRQIYGYFLQQATSLAQAASRQLAFERHDTPPPFIQTDYWETTNQALIAEQNGEDEKRQGILGAERLRLDLEKLDLYAFKTDERRLHITRKISLAAMSPWEFARFRQTGIMLFATPMALFDRDHPGHYMRLIYNVKVAVVGLIPPTAGIHATLTSDRISRVVIGGDLFQITQIAQGPNQVALSSPQEATGIFELDPQTDILRPFEGIGVDTTWEFRMPKASNQIDYNAIADVIITLEYTALNSFDFKQQVIESLPVHFTADRAYSFKHNLPDQWYQFHNPEQSSTPMTVRFETQAGQFPPNLSNFSIAEITLYFSSQSGASFEIRIDQLLFKGHGQEAWIGGSAATVEKTVSTRCSNGASWQALKGKSPFGLWELALPNTLDMRRLFSEEEITDILLVISYQAYTPEWVK